MIRKEYQEVADEKVLVEEVILTIPDGVVWEVTDEKRVIIGDIVDTTEWVLGTGQLRIGQGVEECQRISV